MNFPTQTGRGTSYIRKAQWIDEVIDIELIVQNDVALCEGETVVYSEIVNTGKKTDPWRVSVIRAGNRLFSKAEKISDFDGPLLGPKRIWFKEEAGNWPMVVSNAAKRMHEAVVKAQSTKQSSLF